MLAAPAPVDGIVQVFDDVELVKHDLAVGLRQVRSGGVHVRFPHVRGHGGDPVALGRRQGRPEPVQARLLAIASHVQHAALLEIRHDRQIPVPLGDGLFIDPQPRHHLMAPPGQAALDRARLDPAALVPADARQAGRPP